MSRISATFGSLQVQGRKALIPFIIAGDPDPSLTVSLMHALVDCGADIIEVGVPFSDPIADGPIVQRASERALAKGVSLRSVLGMVTEFRCRNQTTPVVLMGYANPIEAMGVETFARAMRTAGVDGAFVADYPPEEAVEFSKAMKVEAIDRIFLLSPTSTTERIARVACLASGYVLIKGVAGSATLNAQAVSMRISEIRAAVGIPVGVGFGIRETQTANAVAKTADAVIVGSRFAEEIEQSTLDTAIANVRVLASEFRRGVDAAL